MKTVSIVYHKDSGLMTATVTTETTVEPLCTTISKKVFIDIFESLVKNSNDVQIIDVTYSVD